VEVETPPKASRLFLVTLGVVMILLVGLVAGVLVFRLQPALPSTCKGSCTVLAGTVVTMPSGVGKNSQLNFSPGKITVVIGINNSVIFQNLDSVNHTVTALDGSFNSGPIAPGKTWNYTFTTAGSYTYHCLYHPWMQGVVVVKQSVAGAALGIITIPAGTGKNPNYNYEPDSFVVFIGVNNTVEFVNEDSAIHTVTSADGNFSSGNIAPGSAWIYTFTTPGTFTFHCIYHSWMVGTVTVVKPAS